MYGAILGDIIGSVYEGDRHNVKHKDFPLFAENSRFTDDTLMTIAIADGIMNAGMTDDVDLLKKALVQSMQKFGRKYPDIGYGPRFRKWIFSDNPEPYYSYGNGAAMRVSSIAWLYQNDFNMMRTAARASAEVTHNHLESVKAAEATSCIIFMANRGENKQAISNYVKEEFGYNLDSSCDEIRPNYHFDVSCQGTMPPAIMSFLEGCNFEDVIRTAISLGGDSDTIGAIAGGMAEAYYGIPKRLIDECRKRLDRELLDVVDRFTDVLKRMRKNGG